MNAVPAAFGRVHDPAFVSLGALPPGATARVVSVGAGGTLTPLERRLIEFGFVHGEQVEILAEARPGRDPFVVRVGHTTLALRRREAESVWVELHHSGKYALPHTQVAHAANGVELHHSGENTLPSSLRRPRVAARALPHTAPAAVGEPVELQR